MPVPEPQKYPEMPLRQRIPFILLVSFGMFLTLLFGVWWFDPAHIPQNFSGVFHAFDFLLFILLSYLVWLHLGMQLFAWYIASFMRKPNPHILPPAGLRVAYLTAYVPSAEPYYILERTLKAMSEVDYPHDTWLLDEGNDPKAMEICRRYGAHHYSRKDKEHFNTLGGKFTQKTKGGNYNSWLHHYSSDYDIVAQHDVDFVPQSDYLTRTLGYFADPQIAFVGTPQIYGNTEKSWIARGAAEQTYGFYGPLQKGFYGHDMTLLIGANHIMRMKAYEDIDGYTAHITEDMLTGMKLYTHENKWKSVYVPEVLLVGEGPTSWASYFGQQLRWAYGCMDISFRHNPYLFPHMSIRQIANYLLLQQFYFSGIAQAIGIVLLLVYFATGIAPAQMSLLPIFFLYVPLLIYQELFQLWLQRFNIVPKVESGLLLRGKLMFVAAWPIFFIAFLNVLRGKGLTYVVTPKGETQEQVYLPSLFVPHLVLGSLTLIGLLIGVALNHVAGPMVFWAVVNTIFMYWFFFAESLAKTFQLKRTPA